MGLCEPYKGTTLTVRNTGTDPTPTHSVFRTCQTRSALMLATLLT